MHCYRYCSGSIRSDQKKLGSAFGRQFRILIVLKTGHAAGLKIERLIIGRDRQHLVMGIAVVRFGGRVGDAIRKMTADKHGAARNGAPALVYNRRKAVGVYSPERRFDSRIAFRELLDGILHEFRDEPGG